jgi:hypothetical protein
MKAEPKKTKRLKLRLTKQDLKKRKKTERSKKLLKRPEAAARDFF